LLVRRFPIISVTHLLRQNLFLFVRGRVTGKPETGHYRTEERLAPRGMRRLSSLLLGRDLRLWLWRGRSGNWLSITETGELDLAAVQREIVFEDDVQSGPAR
jgi:hypothetical protein